VVQEAIFLSEHGNYKNPNSFLCRTNRQFDGPDKAKTSEIFSNPEAFTGNY